MSSTSTALSQVSVWLISVTINAILVGMVVVMVGVVVVVVITEGIFGPPHHPSNVSIYYKSGLLKWLPANEGCWL